MRQITQAIVTAVGGVNGTGGYVHDLSAAGVVQVGVPTAGDGPVPAVWILPGEVLSVPEEHTSYRRTAQWLVEARVPATSSDLDERTYIAYDLVDDICTALEADRTLGGRVLDLTITGVGTSGGESGAPGVPTAGFIIEAYWLAVTGEGL